MLHAAQPDEDIAEMHRFGKLLGEAFQIVDDVLDFMGDETALGKPVASDLRQGLITLPVLYYYQQHLDDARLQAVLDCSGDENTIQSLVADLRASDAADWAMEQATERIGEANRLLANYPEIPYCRAMEEIATFAVRRRY